MPARRYDRHIKGKVYKVMKEFQEGTLHSGSAKGPLVHSRAQAIAISLSKAGLSRKKRKRRA